MSDLSGGTTMPALEIVAGDLRLVSETAARIASEQFGVEASMVEPTMITWNAAVEMPRMPATDGPEAQGPPPAVAITPSPIARPPAPGPAVGNEPPGQNPPPGGDNDDAGAIAGGIVGVLLLAAAVCAFVWYNRRKRRRDASTTVPMVLEQ